MRPSGIQRYSSLEIHHASTKKNSPTNGLSTKEIIQFGIREA